MNLPNEFSEAMRKLLGEEEFSRYEESLSNERVYGIRLNNKKGSSEHIEQLLKMSGLWEKCGLKKVPWIPNGYYASDTSILSAHPYYRAGLYYIQEPSAMTPAGILPVEPEDRVLDMCAAPGGKATQLSSYLSQQGFLLANDISASRSRALLKNLEMSGADSFCVTAEDPKRLAAVYPEYFDKILLDAPCSGEGMFRRDSKAVGAWIGKGPEFYAPIQEELLECAVKMLKAGGMMVYSTCTFSIKENEERILKLLEMHPELEVCETEPYEGFVPGFKGIKDAVRIFPYKMEGEGHFVCLLRKGGSAAPKASCSIKKTDMKGYMKKLPEHVSEFLSHLRYDFSSGGFFKEKDRIYFFNENTDKKDGLRYLRTGLFMGTQEKGRFEPSQALAMALSKDAFDMSIDLSADDITAEKYIRGESFPVDENVKKGFPWRLVCVDGYPLGWAKLSGGMLKNKYDPGWRKV